jgi:hypothetical protein
MTNVKQIRAIAAVATAGWDPATLRTEQLNDQDTGPILEEVNIGQPLEWKHIANRSPTYRSYWAQWISLVRISILEHQWTVKNSPDSSPSEQSEQHADRSTW